MHRHVLDVPHFPAFVDEFLFQDQGSSPDDVVADAGNIGMDAVAKPGAKDLGGHFKGQFHLGQRGQRLQEAVGQVGSGHFADRELHESAPEPAAERFGVLAVGRILNSSTLR